MTMKDTIKGLIAAGFSAMEALTLAKSGGVTEANGASAAALEAGSDADWLPIDAPTDAAPAAQPEPTKRRRRRYGPRVAYRMTAKARALAAGKGTKAEREAVANMFPSHAAVMKVIAKAKTPLSNRDIEKLSGEKQKTVESAVYGLRHAGLIESVARENGK